MYLSDDVINILCIKMMNRRSIIVALGGLFILVLTVNVFFIRMIMESSSPSLVAGEKSTNPADKSSNSMKDDSSSINRTWSFQPSTTEDVYDAIKIILRMLPRKYRKQNSTYIRLLDRLLFELEVKPNPNGDVLSIPMNWPDAQHLVPPVTPELGTIMTSLRTSKIVKADNAKVGTQLKLMLTLENGARALFKPQWYTRDTIIKGSVYRGKDRHNAEIVAFHLASLLSLRRVPVVVLRKLNLKTEVQQIATPELETTVYDDKNNTCVYGVCHYCTPTDPVCGQGKVLEGALILWMPYKLVKHRNPWQRTYRKNKLAPWETDSGYCEKVKKTKMYSPALSSRLLDLVDTAIFDFLMDNGDRHHYELMQNNFHNPAVLLLDNGKSLGNPHVDHIDILAPLYQCCVLHTALWERLLLLKGGSLSIALKKLLAWEASAANVLPIITDDHLSAIERRLLTIFAVVELCLSQKKHPSDVFFDSR